MSSDLRNPDRSRGGKSRAVAGAQDRLSARGGPEASGVRQSSAASQERHWGQARRAGQQRRRQRESQRWSITFDAPYPLPVTSAELDVIETWLGELLDELLAPCKAA